MNKLFALLFVSVFVVALLAGCAGTKKDTTTPGEPAVDGAAAADTTGGAAAPEGEIVDLPESEEDEGLPAVSEDITGEELGDTAEDIDFGSVI